MGLVCPECSSDSLNVIDVLDLPPDCCDDEIVLQTINCAKCGFHALAAYTESRHGPLNSESVGHEAYRVSEEDFQKVATAIKRCPCPTDRHCQCPTHRTFGQTTANRWDGLYRSGIEILDFTTIRIILE